jgi:hypothetical protein
VAALVASHHPEWSPAEIAERLAHTAADLGPPGWDPLFGYGRVDAAAAVMP